MLEGWPSCVLVWDSYFTVRNVVAKIVFLSVFAKHNIHCCMIISAVAEVIVAL